MKILYTFKVGKPSFEESVVKNDDGTETVTKTKVLTDTEVFIKKPSHREIDEMDLFYSIQISKLQSEGVATQTMILNSYKNSGGVDSKNEVEALKKIQDEIVLKRNRYLKESAEHIENPGLMDEIKDLLVELDNYQSKLSGIFERSAESMADRRIILWACLFLLFLKSGDTYVPLCAGANYSERLETYYNIQDDDSFEFEKEALFKGQVFLSAWFKKQAQNEEDFQLLETMLNESQKDEA